MTSPTSSSAQATDGNSPGSADRATEQAEAAAVNALGGDRTVPVETPPTILKGVELELFSIGSVALGVLRTGDWDILSDADRLAY